MVQKKMFKSKIIAPVPNDVIYTVGLYGWRKRCLYFLLLLFLVTMIVNLALTVWIIKVMNLSTGGMGNLQLSQDGIRLEGFSEFLLPLYVKEIRSRRDSALVLRSERNVTLNVRNSQGHLTGQLTVGESSACHFFFLTFILITVSNWFISLAPPPGSEGAVFRHSVETPLIQSSASEELKLESPTRTLTMGAPRGVEVTSAHGALTVGGRKDLQLQSTEGEIILDAATVRLASLPLGVFAPEPPGRASPPPPPAGQATYEVCVCPSGKLYLSPAASSSTCQASAQCKWG
uniref:Zeta-sarcoglycan n=1 Tax=Gadus morhua TaxID=8049 RepID=A0A8C5F3Q9_GADMO